MKYSVRKLAVLVLFLVPICLPGQQLAASASNAQTAVPQLIKFHGTLRDLAGKPISGPADVTFALYSQETGGSPLWFETQTVQADSLGHYTVLLGVTTPTGVPMELFAAGEARWLGVQVSNLPEQPRVLLVSVPYAMKAGDAETLGGKPASAYMLSSSGSGTGTSGTTSTTLTGLITSGATSGMSTTTTNSSTPITQATTQDYIPMFSDNSGTLTNSVLFQSGARIGMNTNAPAFGLDLNSNSLAVGTKNAQAGAGGTLRFRDDAGTQRWLFGIPGTAGSQDFFMYNYTNGHAPLFIENGAPSYSFYFSSNGNVGVGTTSPGQKLSVAGVVESTSGGFKFPDGTTQSTASAGGGTAIDLNCTSCVSSSEVEFNYASSSSKGGDAANALLLNGLSASAFQPAGDYPTLGANTFSDTQTISSGNLSLPATTGSGSGVISLGGSSIMQAYGSNNLFVGANAGNFTTTGSYNTGSGVYALYSNTEGHGNTATGSSALLFNTSGYQNTATGASALYSNTTGYQNAASGEEALYSNTKGQNNTATGYSALKENISGNDNTAVGWSALSALPYGVANTAVGSSALSASNLGSFNTAVGAFAGPNAAGLSNTTAVGYNAKVSQNNSLILGGTGADAVSVGIGLTAPAYALDVVGDVNVTGCYLYDGSGSYGNCPSDRRLKTNIEPFKPVLEKVVQLQPVHFEWKASNPPGYHFGPGRSTGLIAQQVERVFPALVTTDAKGYERVDYGELPLLLLQGVRDLKDRNDSLRGQVQKQEEQIARLRQAGSAKDAQIAALERQIEQLRQAQEQMALVVARLENAKGQTLIAASAFQESTQASSAKRHAKNNSK